MLRRFQLPDVPTSAVLMVAGGFMLVLLTSC